MTTMLQHTSATQLSYSFTLQVFKEMSHAQSLQGPETALGYHRILSPLAGVRVSPFCLGTMALGDKWTGMMGEMDKKKAFAMFDSFYTAGGNFIDTSSNYQDEQSEEWLGEWMELRGVREQMVVATKFTTTHMQHKLRSTPNSIGSNFGGNSAKSLANSLRDSLKKLRTSYVDILYVHFWDYSTSVEELMRSLDNTVKSGKVLYLGISNTPAWIVVKANDYARSHGLSPFVIYSGLWNVMVRDLEREIIPMCIKEGLAVAPWGAAGQGMFQSASQVADRKKKGEILRQVMATDQSPKEAKVSAALEKIGQEIPDGGASITAVALAYCLQRCPYVFPVIGARKPEQLHSNIRALEFSLSAAQIKYLEDQTEFDPGFPYNIFGGDPHRSGETQNLLLLPAGHIKWVKNEPPIAPVNKM